MVTVQLDGGLGNQMFEYACANAIALRNRTGVMADLTYLHYQPKRSPLPFLRRECDLGIFDLQTKFTALSNVPKFLQNPVFRLCAKYERTFRPKPFFVERDFFAFDPALLAAPGDCRIEGYWQNMGYFSDCLEETRALFSRFRHKLEPAAEKLRSEISACSSVCVHFRRTDFVDDPRIADFMGSPDLDYYKAAVNLMRQRLKDPHLFVFSDEIAWCEQNFKSDLPLTFVGNEYAGIKNSGHFQLMNACKNFIIPNSTFAWWAAWLNRSPAKIVVAPRRWVRDPKIDTSGLFPEDWLTA